MPAITHQLDKAKRLVREGRYGEIVRRVVGRVHEHSRAYGLKRDLDAPHTAPTARIPISVRELQEGDVPLLFDMTSPQLTKAARRDIELRLSHLKEAIPTPYVAIDERNGKPCYVQWLMGAASNDRIQSFFDGKFPVLGADEALLENAYTPLGYRGNGIMPAAMSLIAQRAREIGACYVITFVGDDNVASLKGCRKAGFAPYVVCHASSYAFRLFKRVRFEPLPSGYVLPYEREPSPRAAAA